MTQNMAANNMTAQNMMSRGMGGMQKPMMAMMMDRMVLMALKAPGMMEAVQ